MTPPTNEACLQVQGLSKHISLNDESLDILTDISFEVKLGHTLALTGVSGSGKSTLLSLLAGLDRPSSGSIKLLGHELTRLDEEALTRFRALHFGFVFQNFQLLEHFTAVENVELPLLIQGLPNSKSRAQQLLAEVGLAHRTAHYPKHMSGGEQQRVAIARAYAHKPQLLFADEPTGNLDRNTGQKIIDLLFELNQKQKTTLIIVTHDTSLAERCQQMIHLNQGRIDS